MEAFNQSFINLPDDPELITGRDPGLRVEKKIGQGGFGAVYVMKTAQTDKVFARKTVRISPPDITEGDIQTEAQAIDKLSALGPHPNLVSIWRHGWLQSHLAIFGAPLPVYYFDMELGGKNLHEYIKEVYTGQPRQYLSPSEVWRIMGQISSGLNFMHKNGLIHRDLKPTNGMFLGLPYVNKVIQSLTNPDIWKLTDFGITSKGTSKNPIQTQIGRGTVIYMPPEMLAEDNARTYTNRADVWSLGLILYELFTGRRAFTHCSLVVQYYESRSQPAPAVGLHDNPHLSALLRRMREDEQQCYFDMWRSVQRMSDIDRGLLAKGDTTPEFRLSEINSLLRSMLSRKPRDRPPMRQLALYFAANRLRTLMENDREYVTLTMATLINGISPATQQNSVSSRWQYLIRLESEYTISDPIELYSRLHLLGGRFLTEGNHRDNERALKDILPSSDLRAEFKKLYVEGQSFKQDTLDTWKAVNIAVAEYNSDKQEHTTKKAAPTERDRTMPNAQTWDDLALSLSDIAPQKDERSSANIFNLSQLSRQLPFTPSSRTAMSAPNPRATAASQARREFDISDFARNTVRMSEQATAQSISIMDSYMKQLQDLQNAKLQYIAAQQARQP